MIQIVKTIEKQLPEIKKKLKSVLNITLKSAVGHGHYGVAFNIRGGWQPPPPGEKPTGPPPSPPPVPKRINTNIPNIILKITTDKAEALSRFSRIKEKFGYKSRAKGKSKVELINANIIMCNNKKCKSKDICYRHKATPNQGRQVYSCFKPGGSKCLIKGFKFRLCDYYLPIVDPY